MVIFGLIVRNDLDLVHEVFLMFWLTHYTHRTFIYPFVIDMTNPKMPISIAISAFCFNLVNVSIQAFGIFYFTSYSSDWLSSNTFFIGLSLFFIGMFINIRSDYLIVGLRKKMGPGYHVSDKFLHKYISSPNYFGEIIEWTGWAILTWSISGLVFLVWTIAHHKWYQEKFDNYPKNRKAIIPGII
jgi:steroid 5-alpha reductase family enzyme